MAGPSSPRFVRLVVPLLVGVGLALVVTWWMRDSDLGARDETTGLVAHVLVVDPSGKPLPGALLQARYGSAEVTTSSRGTARMTDVPLRAGEETSPRAVAAAIAVEAPGHAARGSGSSTARLREDGAWDVRIVLEPYGVIRVALAGTGHADARAWIERSGATWRHVAPDGSADVARPEQPAAWRVFSGVEAVVLRVEGRTGTAMSRRVVRAPGPGFVRSIVVELEDARPIHGRIHVPVGTPPPTLAGHLEVRQIGDDGSELELPDVLVARDGTFEVPYAGASRYRLRPVLGFATVATRVTEGGAHLDLDVDGLRPWAVLPTAAWGGRHLTARATVERRPDGGSAHVPHGLFVSESPTVPDGVPPEGIWAIALPEAGRYRIGVRAPGGPDRRPAAGEADLEVSGSGPHALSVILADLPAGHVTVRLRTADGHGVAGTVRLRLAGSEPSARSATVLPRLSGEAAFPNVAAGDVRAEVRWRDAAQAIVFLAGTLEPDAALTLDAVPETGGVLEIVNPPDAAAALRPDDGHRVLYLPPGSTPYGDAEGTLRLLAEPASDRWRSAARLRPGRYEARIRPGDRRITFEIGADATTVVELTDS